MPGQEHSSWYIDQVYVPVHDAIGYALFTTDENGFEILIGYYRKKRYAVQRIRREEKKQRRH